ncbi:MAG: hypothetical protein ACI9US_002960 [Gammaproteobacteria bacterium]
MSLSTQLKKQQLGVQFVEKLMWDKPAASKVKGLVLGLGNTSTLQIPETVCELTRALQIAMK